jgi:hypothetical protein
MNTTDEILAAARHLVQAFGRHDTAAYFDCFAPDATSRTWPGVPATRRRDDQFGTQPKRSSDGGGGRS